MFVSTIFLQMLFQAENCRPRWQSVIRSQIGIHPYRLVSSLCAVCGGPLHISMLVISHSRLEPSVETITTCRRTAFDVIPKIYMELHISPKAWNRVYVLTRICMTSRVFAWLSSRIIGSGHHTTEHLPAEHIDALRPTRERKLSLPGLSQHEMVWEGIQW